MSSNFISTVTLNRMHIPVGNRFYNSAMGNITKDHVISFLRCVCSSCTIQSSLIEPVSCYRCSRRICTTWYCRTRHQPPHKCSTPCLTVRNPQVPCIFCIVARTAIGSKGIQIRIGCLFMVSNLICCQVHYLCSRSIRSLHLLHFSRYNQQASRYHNA